MALLREAIARAEHDALVVPEMLAALHGTLANRVAEDPLAPRAEALDEAIAHYEVALRAYPLDRFPVQYAKTQNNLGNAWRERIAGGMSDNLEAAIAACEQALLVYTLDRFPLQYAGTQNNLGLAYAERIAEEKSENLEAAIGCFREALRVRTLDRFPADYAKTQNNLGNAYAERIAGVERDNLEAAIAACEQALLIYTFEQFPVDYARAQNNLGNAYAARIAGGKSDNLEAAIAAYAQALLIYTLKQFPVDYARTQNNLGTTYAVRIAGVKRENLEAAIAAYEQALLVYTLEQFPHVHRDIKLNLAWLAVSGLAGEARGLGDHGGLRRAYTLADEAYTAARRAQAQMGWLESDAAGKASLLGQHAAIREMYTRHAWLLAQLGEPRRATAALEAGRAQALAQTQAIIGAALEGLSPEERELFESARARLEAARGSGNEAAVKVAYADFLKVREAIRGDREHPRHPDFLPDEPEWRDVAQAAPEQTLVYLAATDFGGLALILPPSRGDDAEQREPILLELPQLTWDVVDDWLTRPDAKGKVVGGWRLAIGRQVLGLLYLWLQRLEEEQGEAAAERLLQLKLTDVHDALPPAMHTLRTALKRTLHVWRAEARENAKGDTEQQRETARLLDLRLRASLGEALNMPALESQLGWFYTEAELEYLLPEISRVVMQPLREKLDALGLGDPDQPVALVACGRLGALPLHAAEVYSTGRRKGRVALPFQETCELSYQPGARSLRTAREAAGALPRRGPFLTVGDPPTGGPALPRARDEAEEIANLARMAGRETSRALLGKWATLPALVGRAALPGAPETPGLLREARTTYRGAWVLIASHGSADPANPNKCFMLLARGERLTLSYLQRERILVGVRCFIASGCVTSVGDLETAPDELSSFAAGTLQAGAASTLATQWSVSDTANYLLMLRCAKEALEHPDWRPAKALRAAARWLRTATVKDVGTLQAEASKGLARDAADDGERKGTAEMPTPGALVGARRGATRDALRGAVTPETEAEVAAGMQSRGRRRPARRGIDALSALGRKVSLRAPHLLGGDGGVWGIATEGEMMADDEESILLRALDRAAVLAMAEEAKQEGREQAAPVFRGGRGGVRGAPDAQRDDGSEAATAPATGGKAADMLLSQLDGANAGIEDQIGRVQAWLRAHQDLLRLLDKGIRGEVGEMERRLTRKNIGLNVLFTVLGAILGLVLPYVIGNLSSLTGLFVR